MATTLNLSVSASWEQGTLRDSFQPTISAITLNVQGQAGGIQTIGTSEEDLGATDLATNGYLFMQNLDATNYITWGMSDSGTMKAVGRLKAGEVALLRVNSGVTVRLLANTAACKLYYKFLND